jgi:hypothetical protein
VAGGQWPVARKLGGLFAVTKVWGHKFPQACPLKPHAYSPRSFVDSACNVVAAGG